MIFHCTPCWRSGGFRC